MPRRSQPHLAAAGRSASPIGSFPFAEGTPASAPAPGFRPPAWTGLQDSRARPPGGTRPPPALRLPAVTVPAAAGSALPHDHGEPPSGTGPPAASGAFSYLGGDANTGTGSLPAVAGGLLRRQGTFTGRVTRDGSSGFAAEPARYQLYASLACPWSQRILIACRLLGLDRIIGLTLTDPVADERGWRFSDDGSDPITGARFLAELYRATDPHYPGPFTVPLLWDLRAGRIVSNDVTQLGVMLEIELRAFHRPGAPDLYPSARRSEIESLATLIYHTVNTGVYKAGLATDQASYDQAVEAVFTTLDALEERLARRRFLLGGMLTEADIRLYPTLARFDPVYYQLFNCNLRRLCDYQQLWGYARDLYTHPGFGETTDLAQIKRHYFLSPEWGNTSGIIPAGPQLSWNEPHGRARMLG